VGDRVCDAMVIMHTLYWSTIEHMMFVMFSHFGVSEIKNPHMAEETHEYYIGYHPHI